MVRIPIVMVDDGMTERAVAMGARIGVAATAAATLRPTAMALEQAANKMGKTINIQTYLADGALDVLMKEKNRERHDELVLDLLKRAEKENDLIVLAQGSMITLEPYLSQIAVPVLTSPRLGVQKARSILFGNESV
jgi:Asp/Glu/hydantoin racemase